MKQLLVWIADWLALLLSDWAHPEQKAEREKVEAQTATQNAVIEQHTAIDKVLTAQAREEDAAIVAGQKKLDEILKPLPKVERTEGEEFDRLSERIK